MRWSAKGRPGRMRQQPGCTPSDAIELATHLVGCHTHRRAPLVVTFAAPVPSIHNATARWLWCASVAAQLQHQRGDTQAPTGIHIVGAAPPAPCEDPRGARSGPPSQSAAAACGLACCRTRCSGCGAQAGRSPAHQLLPLPVPGAVRAVSTGLTASCWHLPAGMEALAVVGSGCCGACRLPSDLQISVVPEGQPCQLRHRIRWTHAICAQRPQRSQHSHIQGREIR